MDNNLMENNVPLGPPPKPNYLTKLIDFLSRAVRGELHLPPWWLRDVGGADFEAVGQEFLEIFKQLASLQPYEHILEVGCGSGRMAYPLTGYLSQEGRYIGMDVTTDSIIWCQKNITARYPNFEFLHADLYNKRYNPSGRYLAKEYTFPFEAESFDFIFLTSVFTHLLPDDTENYLNEIFRLLRSDGRALITFFLLNEKQQELAAQGRNDINFQYSSGVYRTRSETVPESAVAYDETYLRQLIAQCGLEISEPIHYGVWSGRAVGLSYQDILLIRHSGK
jgi:SAM-dependent methyltransferase